MTPDSVFSYANTFALLAWLFLIGPARWMPRTFACVRLAVPLVLSCVYVAAFAEAWPAIEGGFGSLDAVRTLFGQPWVLLAGWVHYLAFDYSVGGWMLERAKADNLSHLAVVPVLALTFLLGPAGFFVFHLLRNVTLRFRRKAA